jgi:hypothetical protein
MAHLLKQRARILYGALSLESFTTEELAEFCGVKVQTVRTALARESNHFECIGQEATGARGGKRKRYVLRPESRAELSQEVGELPGQVLTSRVPPAETARDEDRQRVTIALSAARDTIDRARATQIATDRNELREHASAQLEHARAVALLATDLPEFASWQSELAALKLRLDESSAGQTTGAEQAKARSGTSRLYAELRAWLFDWVGPLSVSRTHLISSLAKALRLDFGGDSEVDPEFLSASLLSLLLNPRCKAQLAAEQRDVAMSALAYLARPAPGHLGMTAASACHLLCTQETGSARDLPLMVPAAIRARGINAGEVLHRLARARYCDPAGTLTGLDDVAALRNLAFSMYSDKFAVLCQHVESLLVTDYGRSFVTDLTDPGCGAMEILDNHDEGFEVRPGPYLVDKCRIEIPDKHALPTRRGTPAGDVLRALLAVRSAGLVSARERDARIYPAVAESPRSPTIKPLAPQPLKIIAPYAAARADERPTYRMHERWQGTQTGQLRPLAQHAGRG